LYLSKEGELFLVWVIHISSSWMFEHSLSQRLCYIVLKESHIPYIELSEM